MGARRVNNNCAKGPVPYWLDQCSISARAVERLTALLDAIKKLGPTYAGLETAFDECLAAHHCSDTGLRQRIREHLRKYWFSDGTDTYFPGQRVTQKYAEAVIKTIELSLNGRHHPVPISAWWVIEPAERSVRLLNLAEVDRNGMTVSSSVTLLIMTPIPRLDDAPSKTTLWGDAEVWVTEDQEAGTVTRRIEKVIE